MYMYLQFYRGSRGNANRQVFFEILNSAVYIGELQNTYTCISNNECWVNNYTLRPLHLFCTGCGENIRNYISQWSGRSSYLEAAKRSWELAASALMGLLCAWTSPTNEQLSTFQTFSRPPRQQLSRWKDPGIRTRPVTQSSCALFIICTTIHTQLEVAWWHNS